MRSAAAPRMTELVVSVNNWRAKRPRRNSRAVDQSLNIDLVRMAESPGPTTLPSHNISFPIPKSGCSKGENAADTVFKSFLQIEWKSNCLRKDCQLRFRKAVRAVQIPTRPTENKMFTKPVGVAPVRPETLKSKSRNGISPRGGRIRLLLLLFTNRSNRLQQIKAESLIY